MEMVTGCSMNVNHAKHATQKCYHDYLRKSIIFNTKRLTGLLVYQVYLYIFKGHKLKFSVHVQLFFWYLAHFSILYCHIWYSLYSVWDIGLKIWPSKHKNVQELSLVQIYLLVRGIWLVHNIIDCVLLLSEPFSVLFNVKLSWRM